MLKDLADLPTGTTLTTDVCIVGAGAAGITLCRALANTSLDVCLLESGGFDYEPAIADLGAGENLAHPYYDLVDSRLRFFGGTTNIWGGRCVSLDPEDFEAKPWVPHSGWPIGIGDLAEGYARAHQDLEIGPTLEEGEGWCRLKAAPPDYLRDDFTSSFWYFDEQAERFNASRCEDLFAASNVQVITHASVTHLQAQPNVSGLARMDVRAPGGKHLSITARAYVLAAGAIENARLMLMSRDVETAGIGNRHDQVGRYFMEHPHGRLGLLDSPEAFLIWETYRKRFLRGHVPLAPVLRPSRALQEREGILNTALTFKLQRDPASGPPLARRAYQSLKHELSPTRSNRALWHAFNRLRRTIQRRREPLMRHLANQGRRRVYAMIRAEQAPNPDSRVTLSGKLDGFGNPRADLHWRTNDQDKHTLRVMARVLASTLERQDLGTFRAEPWLDDPDPAWPVDPTVGNHPIGGYHHMGTTRMASSPEHGVTDKNCQVFGYSNLFVAGSSVFTTAGWANPTLTILALSHRLAGHLRQTVK
ncbi:MAG: GMC family oxidoreductase [Pseudomonadales bacterium]|jgi:choline dehydrogenase-like flavoprotein